jgi:hypothetical protein
MKKSELREGGVYLAKVNGRVVRVRLNAIREFNPSFGGGLRRTQAQTRYDVTNLETGRQTTFRSATKFREPVQEQKAAPTPEPSVSDILQSWRDIPAGSAQEAEEARRWAATHGRR